MNENVIETRGLTLLAPREWHVRVPRLNCGWKYSVRQERCVYCGTKVQGESVAG